MASAERIPWHPIVFGAGLVGMFWVDAAVSPFTGMRSLLVTVAAITTCQALLTIAVRDARRAALATSGLFLALLAKLVFIAAGSATDAMAPSLAILWIALVGLAGLLVIRIVRRRARTWSVPGATYALNVISASILVIVVASAVTQGRVEMIARDLHQGRLWSATQPAGRNAGESSELPDVYVLLLDGYPGADALNRVFGFDNAPFFSALQGLGFDVAQNSRSDYLWTHLTLMSMLHLDYLERVPSLDDLRRPGAAIHPRVREVINDNPTFDDLRGAGYTIYATAVPIERYAMRGADVLIDSGRLNEFEIQLLSSTFVSDLLNVVRPDFAAGEHRQRILDDLAALPQIAAEAHPSPRFVFAHLLTPHHPVVWDADGSPVNPPLEGGFYADALSQHEISRTQFINEYVEQLRYLNGLILETIDRIQAASASPPVIIVMSDHGTGVGLDPTDAEAGDTMERTSNLFAASTPDHPSVFPDDITPVNVMRLLLDAYLGTEFGEADPLPHGMHISLDELHE